MRGRLFRVTNLLAGVEPNVLQEHDVTVAHRGNALLHLYADAVVHLDDLRWQKRGRGEGFNSLQKHYRR